MNPWQIKKWIRGYFPRDEEGCPGFRTEEEVDITQMTLGEYQEFIERLEKIRNLDNHPHTICQHVKLMREAIEIITAHEKKEPEKT